MTTIHSVVYIKGIPLDDKLDISAERKLNKLKKMLLKIMSKSSFYRGALSHRRCSSRAPYLKRFGNPLI